MPTPTNRYMNWSAVAFTPPAPGTAIPITGIKNCQYNEGIQVNKESADFDSFPTVSVTPYLDPTFTITTIDAMALISQVAGVRGSLTATLRDAYNGATAGGGAKIFAVTNAQIQDRATGGAYREYAQLNMTFGTISSDGQTHPVAVSAA